MTIVHVVEAFAGGIAVFVKSLVQHMPDDLHIIVYGERPEVNTFKSLRKDFPRNNVRFLRWRSVQRSLHPVKDLAAFFQLHAILKGLKRNNMLDAVHLHSSKSGFIGRIVCRLLHIEKVVYTPNGAPFLVSSNEVTNFIYKQLEKLGSLFGGQVVCCSQSEQEAYQEAGIRAITINNGITPEFLSVAQEPMPKSKFRVLTSGRILDQKNPSLFNQIATYFQDLDQFEFIWVGDGPDNAVLTASNIHITGWLTPAEALRYVQSADVYLSTSRFEGLSFSVLEALSLSKPVLLSDCVGNRDMVMKGANGSLFQQPYQAIVSIMQYYNNLSMLDIMGMHSATYCKSTFHIETTQQQYKNLYLSGKKMAVA